MSTRTTVLTVVAFLLVPGRSWAQNTPWPCEFASGNAQLACLATEQAVTDSALATVRRLAASAPGPLDSLQASERLIPAAWNSFTLPARTLLVSRFKLEVLRNHLERVLARSDSSLRTLTPVESRFRPDEGGHGLLMILTNYGGSRIAPSIQLYSPMRDERRTLPLELEPGRSQYWGWRQGWTFEPGDMVEVRQAGHFPRLTIAR